MPLTAWVLQGSFGCGEEPDSGEDLQIQYIDSGGTWVTLNLVWCYIWWYSSPIFNQFATSSTSCQHPN